MPHLQLYDMQSFLFLEAQMALNQVYEVIRPLLFLHFDSYCGMADYFVAELVAGLKFLANNFNLPAGRQASTACIFHTNRFVKTRIKLTPDSFNSLNAQLLKTLLKLLNNTLHAFDIVVGIQILRNVHQRTLQIV